MEIKYLFDDSFLFEKKRKKMRKRFSILLSKLKEDGIKKVVVLDNSVEYKKTQEKGRCVFLVFTNGGTCLIQWVEDGKLHREDGPAVQYYGRTNKPGEQTSADYWYKGNRCYVTNTIEILKKGINVLGDIILHEEMVTENVLYIKRLSKNDLTDYYYWILPLKTGE